MESFREVRAVFTGLVADSLEYLRKIYPQTHIQDLMTTKKGAVIKRFNAYLTGLDAKWFDEQMALEGVGESEMMRILVREKRKESELIKAGKKKHPFFDGAK